MTETNEPAWLAVLREQCVPYGGQARAAEKIGYSATVVNQVLKGKYPGDLKAVQARVEGVLMGVTVECPIVGELPRNRCLDYQVREFAATNHLRVQLSRACPRCPHRKGGVQ